MNILKIITIFLILTFFACTTPQKSSNLNQEKLNTMLEKLQKEAKAEIEYSVLEIQKKNNIPESFIFNGKYEIFKYQPGQKYSFNITLLIEEKIIQIFKKKLKFSKKENFVEKKSQIISNLD